MPPFKTVDDPSGWDGIITTPRASWCSREHRSLFWFMLEQLPKYTQHSQTPETSIILENECPSPTATR